MTKKNSADAKISIVKSRKIVTNNKTIKDSIYLQ